MGAAQLVYEAFYGEAELRALESDFQFQSDCKAWYDPQTEGEVSSHHSTLTRLFGLFVFTLCLFVFPFDTHPVRFGSVHLV
jgi:hypothetical protein